MNVALIIERIEAWRGGAETSTLQFAEHLAADGCRVHIITTSYSPSTPSLDIVPIRVGGRLRSWRTRQFAEQAARHVRANQYDIVHCITPCLAADVYQPRGGAVPETLARNLALRSSPLRRCLKCVGQRLNLKYRVMAGLERKLLTRSPAPWVIAISQYVVQQLERHYAFPSDRIRMIFNGVDPDTTPAAERVVDRTQVRRQFGLFNDDLVVLCVAHNFKLKGVGPLIRALASCVDREKSASGHRPKAYALILGRDNPSAFVRLAARLNVADRVLFAGPTPRVQAFFHAADMLVHDTYYDPCSRVVLEAMSAGLPVVTTRYNGASERIKDGQEGYIIDSPDDVEGLADRIERLTDPEHRRACSAHAIRAVEDFSMRRHARCVRELYEDILKTGQVARGGYR